jgi:hypothetical protein
MPVDVAGDEQELWLIQRLATRLEWRALGPVRFVPLVSPVLQNPLRRIMPPADWSSGHEAIVTAL